MIQFTYNLKEDFKNYASLCLNDNTLVLNDQIKDIIQSIEKKERGVLIYGNVGSGKTFIMDILLRVIHTQDKKKFSKVNAIDLITEFNLNGHDVFKKYHQKNVFFDDLGAETKGKFYGENMEAFEKLIQIRYNEFRDFGTVTHFTTNLTKNEILERYGERIVSRLKEMCDITVLGGNSKEKDMRGLRNFKSYPAFTHPKIKSKEELEWESNYNALKQKAEFMPVENNYKGLGSKLAEQWGFYKK
jgi:DNA replication protein DnaC